MGYRELLKRYLLCIERITGSNLVERIANAAEASMSPRDIGELRAIASEIVRERQNQTLETANQQFVRLLRQHSLNLRGVSNRSGIAIKTLRRYCLGPTAKHHLKLTDNELARFKAILTNDSTEIGAGETRNTSITRTRGKTTRSRERSQTTAPSGTPVTESFVASEH